MYANKTCDKAAPPKYATGHELPLASMVRGRKPIMISMASGQTIFGVVQGFDRFTVTLSEHYTIAGEGVYTPSELKRGSPKTIFKHSMDSFEIVVEGKHD